MDDDVRRELDQLRQDGRDLRQAITDLDNHGSRGVLQIAGQVTDLIKDFSDLKATFTAHEQLHEKEREDRRAARRWLVATVIGGLGGMVTVIGLLVDVLRHVH